MLHPSVKAHVLLYETRYPPSEGAWTPCCWDALAVSHRTGTKLVHWGQQHPATAATASTSHFESRERKVLRWEKGSLSLPKDVVINQDANAWLATRIWRCGNLEMPDANYRNGETKNPIELLASTHLFEPHCHTNLAVCFSSSRPIRPIFELNRACFKFS